MVNAIVRYFDLYADWKPSGAKAHATSGAKIEGWRQLLVYLACLLGVILAPYVSAALSGSAPSFSEVFASANRIGWSAVIALAVFPISYKTILSPKLPLVAQLGTALVTGFVAQKIVPKAIDLILGK